VWYRVGQDFIDSYNSDRVSSVIVTGCLHLTVILQGGLYGEWIGSCSHLTVVVVEHKGL